ncbi:MAG: hypothetical protein ACRDRL_00045 [Sciscionella sp.]
MLDETTIQKYIQLDNDVSNYQDRGDGLYQFDAGVNGRPELGMAPIVLSTKVNPTMVQMLSKIDVSGDGLAATGTAGVVGAVQLGEAYYLRYTIFRDFAEPLAITNGIQALAFAYSVYRQHAPA